MVISFAIFVALSLFMGAVGNWLGFSLTVFVFLAAAATLSLRKVPTESRQLFIYKMGAVSLIFASIAAVALVSSLIFQLGFNTFFLGMYATSLLIFGGAFFIAGRTANH